MQIPGTLKSASLMILLIATIGGIGCQSDNGKSTASANPVGEGSPQKISNQFSFTEGPAVDPQGNVYFTDQPNNKIWKYGTDDSLSLFMDSAGRSNGLYFDRKGNIIACADEHDQLWSISPEKNIKVLVRGFNGKLLNGPNDLWIAPEGGIYFTDPYYQRDYWTRTSPEQETQNVYYLAQHDTVPVVVANDLQQPNGIVGSPDGKYLFVADIRAGKTYKYQITADGTLANKQLFVNQGSDGITLDGHGNLYLTGKGVTIYNSNGEKIGHIDVPEESTSNVCFGGKNRDQLFITARTAIYVQPMKVKGVE